MDYRKSHLHPDKGESYHSSFSKNPYRKMVWHFEKDILEQILSQFYKCSEIHHFDFACGTGRILSHLANRTTRSVGVDLSPSMLEIARKDNSSAEIIEADLTQNDILKDQRFNLITAFRFFPNAEEELRMEAMQVLVRHLEDDGYIVFNNHMNTGSIRQRLNMLIRRRQLKGMNLAEVKSLLAKNGLEIVKIYHLCVFPASESHMLLPAFLLRPIDALLSKCIIFQNYGENLIFVCRRCVTM
jgi:predicted TPR repeat methyltransferase